jgi:hypothetical protein
MKDAAGRPLTNGTPNARITAFMIRSEDLKAYREIAEWLESAEGRFWRHNNISIIRYGMETVSYPGTYGLFTVKSSSDDSGSERDFCAVMSWGNLPGDAKLAALYNAGEYPEPLVR